jgi:SAM-dependent methyltransferase
LIEEKGWTVANLPLTELFGALGAHIRVLVMAHESKLLGMTESIKNLVFPLEIDGALETEVRKLQDRYSELLHGHTDKKAPVQLDKTQQKTISYYDKNSSQYYQQTAFINISDIYHEFEDHIPRGSLILDAGCGVGRDTRYFIKHGYRVVSFDASEEMVKLCRQYPFAYCLHRSFSEVSFTEEFDAVWACASLVHLSDTKLQEAICQISNAAKPGGIIYFSLKMRKNDEKISEEVIEGRHFYYYSFDEITKITEQRLSLSLRKTWTNNSRKQTDSTGQWTNFLYQKPK